MVPLMLRDAKRSRRSFVFIVRLKKGLSSKTRITEAEIFDESEYRGAAGRQR